jgi:hypothetical protein
MRLRITMGIAALAAAMLCSGHARADEVWIGTYQHRLGKAQCRFTVVRSERQVEHRGCGHPTRIWHRLDDGVELLELHPEQGRAVRFAPGDLRALQREPDWARISMLVPPYLRASLGTGKPARVLRHDALRYRGRGPDGRRVELDWLIDADLPAHYRIGDRRGGEQLTLERLERGDASSAFASTANLREIDAADLGD